MSQVVHKSVDIDDLDENSFIGVRSSNTNKILIRHKIANIANNILQLTNAGLQVVIPMRRDEFTLDEITAKANTINGRNGKLQTVGLGGNGIIHIDFTYRGRNDIEAGETIYRINNGAPTCPRLIEIMVERNPNGHDTCVWIDPNSRDIKIKRAIAGKRYIVNIPGIFG